jgi:hypothetical protein
MLTDVWFRVRNANSRVHFWSHRRDAPCCGRLFVGGTLTVKLLRIFFAGRCSAVADSKDLHLVRPSSRQSFDDWSLSQFGFSKENLENDQLSYV